MFIQLYITCETGRTGQAGRNVTGVDGRGWTGRRGRMGRHCGPMSFVIPFFDHFKGHQDG